MSRALRTPLLTCLVFCLTAQMAIAAGESDAGHDGGEGWWGETNDKIVTNYGFILIAFFPLFVLLASLAYPALENLRVNRLKAEKARKLRADLRGGW